MTGDSALQFQWILPSPLPPGLVDRYPRASRALLQVLYHRQVLTDEPGGGHRLQHFLSTEASYPDPFLMKDMDRAVERIVAEIASGRPIGIFGHYDCDGVTATALLYEALLCLGAQPVPYIPGREEEYGIPRPGLEYLAARGVKLVVTVDCGIRSIEHVRIAASMGLEVVITDHHQCDQEDGQEIRDLLPAAAAVVNPRRMDCAYPFKKLAGVGIAFRLAQALASARPESDLTPERLESLLDLVGLGTIADVVDLVDENRRLVAGGLKKLQEFRRPGLCALARVAAVRPDSVSVRTVSFGLAPRINAAQRMKHGKLGLRLLLAGSVEEAAPLAREMEELNRRGQELTEEAVRTAFAQIDSGPTGRSILVVSGNWLPGLSGLVASRVKEAMGRPILAICDPQAGASHASPDDHCSGSGRSVEGFDITAALTHARELLIRFGGHTGAAGFTVKRGDIRSLADELEDYAAQTLKPEALGPRLVIDGVLPADELTTAFRKQLQRFEPCGQGNPSPVFLVPGAIPIPGSLRTYQHDNFSFAVRTPGQPARVSGRGSFMASMLAGGAPLDLVFSISTTEGAGLALKMLDVARSGQASDREAVT